MMVKDMYNLEDKLDVKFLPLKDETRADGRNWQVYGVILHDAVRIGTITFRDCLYYSHKPQKSETRRDLCIIDEKFFRLERYMVDGVIIPLAMWKAMIPYAEQISAYDLAQKHMWRHDNPKVKDGKIIPRRPLLGKNIRYIMRALCLNVSVDPNEFKTSLKTVIDEYYKLKGLAKRL